MSKKLRLTPLVLAAQVKEVLTNLLDNLGDAFDLNHPEIEQIDKQFEELLEKDDWTENEMLQLAALLLTEAYLARLESEAEGEEGDDNDDDE